MKVIVFAFQMIFLPRLLPKIPDTFVVMLGYKLPPSHSSRLWIYGFSKASTWRLLFIEQRVIHTITDNATKAAPNLQHTFVPIWLARRRLVLVMTIYCKPFVKKRPPGRRSQNENETMMRWFPHCLILTVVVSISSISHSSIRFTTVFRLHSLRMHYYGRPLLNAFQFSILTYLGHLPTNVVFNSSWRIPITRFTRFVVLVAIQVWLTL